MAIEFSSFTDEFCKLAAAPISRDEAEKSLKRIQTMSENRDLGALGRSAMVGSALSPIAATFTRSVSGAQKWLKPGAALNLKSPKSIAKAVNWSGLGRQAAADAAGGAIFGGALPLAREAVEGKAQKERLLDYLAQEQGNRRDKTLRRHIAANIGL